MHRSTNRNFAQQPADWQPVQHVKTRKPALYRRTVGLGADTVNPTMPYSRILVRRLLFVVTGKLRLVRRIGSAVRYAPTTVSERNFKGYPNVSNF
jgi:hypothetical protein